MIDEKAILRITHYGLNIYAHILRKYYPDEIVVELLGKECKPTKNPFNGDKKTLKMYNRDWVFYYTDTGLPDFNGNPFDFAALHFQLCGYELLQKINDEMNLHIGQPKGFYTNEKIKIQLPEVVIDLPKFSYFRCPVTNTLPNYEMTIPDVYGAIKSNKYQRQTIELRSILSPLPLGEGQGVGIPARKYKAKHFDYVTFSGTFSKRNDAALIQHSGLITLDFDHVSNLKELKETLLQDQYFETELMFFSPSGDGLKWIVPIDLKEGTHLQLFKAIAAYIKATYKLEIDNSGKDISRACFLPFDPEVYINPKYNHK
ncbi:MAG TPA: BT4734/BF3469 family protein [Prolixibacteraceae bacterium]|nr:BT4734/BF3469 family protein [Prolixibacteraceae bacterium]